jgi:hypothetical protein
LNCAPVTPRRAAPRRHRWYFLHAATEIVCSARRCRVFDGTPPKISLKSKI